MSQFWREYNIFISSTFRDMDAERDAIKQFVIPRLNKHYRSRCIKFHAIDLRFGVNTQNLGEEESENMVLSACFSKIDSSRPFFIGLLGERYGWIPSKERIDYVISSLAKQKRLMLCGGGRSVTELEMLYGVIGDEGESINHSIFFFRDKDSYLNIPPDLKSDFDDRYNSALSVNEREHLAEKQVKLKSKIKEICSANLSNYKCVNYHLDWSSSTNSYADMSDFVNLVYERLSSEVEKEIESVNTSISWYDVEEETSLYLIHTSDKYYRNDKVLNAIISELQSTSRIAIVAKDGFGKTTIASQLYKKMSSDPRTIVLMINPEISPYTDVVENILFYWSLAIQKLLGLEQVDEMILRQKNAYKTLYDTFYALVGRARKQGYNVVAIIDGVESIRTGKDLLWIHDDIPLIVTVKESLPGYEAIVLDHESVDWQNIFANHEVRHNMTLPVQVCESILSGDKSPVDIALFSTMFSNLASKDFSQIRRFGTGSEIEKINDYITSVYEDAQRYVGSLFVYVLNFLLERMDAAYLREAVEYIAISEEGLRLSDLAVLLGDKWCEMKFLVLMELMGDFFMENPLTKQWKLKNLNFQKELRSSTDHIQKERGLLRLIEQYEDDDPIKRSILLMLSVSSGNSDIVRKYLTLAYVGDKKGNIWVTNVSVALMMKSDSWSECLVRVLPDMTSEEKVCLIFSLCNVLNLTRDQGTVKALVNMLDNVDISCLSPEGCYTLAYLFRDSYLLHKYDDVPDQDARSKLLERMLECHETCRSIAPEFRDNNLLYMAILAEYATDLSMRGEYEKADEILGKMLIN